MNEFAQTGTLAGSAHVVFVREHFIVERSDVADVRPHLEQHDSKVIFLAAAPIVQRGMRADVVQQGSAEFREGRNLPRQARQTGGNVKPRRKFSLILW